MRGRERGHKKGGMAGNSHTDTHTQARTHAHAHAHVHRDRDGDRDRDRDRQTDRQTDTQSTYEATESSSSALNRRKLSAKNRTGSAGRSVATCTNRHTHTPTHRVNTTRSQRKQPKTQFTSHHKAHNTEHVGAIPQHMHSQQKHAGGTAAVPTTPPPHLRGTQTNATSEALRIR